MTVLSPLENKKKLHDYTGIIHFHSSYSYDGHVSMEKILSAAKKNNIDFLMLTDHDHLRAREEGWEGWQEKTLVIVGEEIAPRFNHYLAFNISKPISCKEDPEGEKPQKYIDEVNAQGGFGIIAHPDHEGTAMFHVKHYCWNNWNVRDYSAISVWDFMTDWQKSLQGYFRSFLSFLFPAFFLKGPSRLALNRWDDLNQISKTVGIGELDNHGSIKQIFGIRFIAFPFVRAFKFIRTHVLFEKPLSGNSKQDISNLFCSLKHGRCYFAFEYFRQAKGFQFFVENENQIFSMGDFVTLKSNALLSVSCPSPSKIIVIRNGQEYMRTFGTSLSLRINKPGVYRIEVFFTFWGKLLPWIFSNPIFINKFD